MPSADELGQKMDAVLGGLPEPVAEKYKLFFIENLRGSVMIDELVQFVRLRCPNDARLANNILQGFITSARIFLCVLSFGYERRPLAHHLRITRKTMALSWG